MKTLQTLSKHSNKITICIIFALFFTIGGTLYAQPSWTPTAASIADNTFSISGPAATINCDMYTDMETGAPTDYVTAIVYNRLISGTGTNVYLRVEDAYSSTVFNVLIASNATDPDVIIGDDGNATSGSLKVAVVYTDLNTNDVKYVEIPFSNMCNPSGGGLPSMGSVSAATTLNTNVAQTPHIDAYPQPTGGYWGVTNPYEGLTGFAVTWQENASGTNEIWVNNGDLTGGGVTGTATYIDDGTMPDIAGVYETTAPIELTYISYIQDGTGDLMLAEYDITNTSVLSSSSIESGSITTQLPRIDAMNVQNPGTGNVPWVVVAQVDNGGAYEIRAYDVNGTFDFAAYAPFTTHADGYKPVVASGPGPDDFSGLTSEFGNNKYLEAFTIKIGELEATDYDAASTSYGGYYDINKTPLNTSVGLYPKGGRAVSTSSNCGVGHLAAWLNHDGSTYYIGWKVNTGTSASFKPTGINSIVESEYITYPNPANSYVGVSGLLANTDYFATDITGKTVLSGTIEINNPKIDISKLTSGVYIFTFDENGIRHNLKFVKQ